MILFLTSYFAKYQVVRQISLVGYVNVKTNRDRQSTVKYFSIYNRNNLI